MKKLVSLFLAVVLMISLLTFAMASAGYVRSPGSSPLPDITVDVDDPEYPAEITDTQIEENGSVVIEIHQQIDDCYDDLIITPYSGKNEMVQIVRDMAGGKQEYIELSEESKAALEAAYNEVMTIRDNGGLLTSLKPLDGFVEDLEAAARRAGTTVSNIYVSDLFDITFYECIDDTIGPGQHSEKTQTQDGHEEIDPKNDKHARVYKINVDDFVLRNFVALLHRPSDQDGAWEVVDANVDTVNNTIDFKINVIPRDTEDPADMKSDEVNLSPFAIVVKKTAGGGHIDGPNSPKTADPVSLVSLGTAMLASIGGVVVLNKRKHD